MSDKIDVRLKFNPNGSVADELTNLAMAMDVLYRTAARKWPGRQLRPNKARVEGESFTVELEPWPEMYDVKCA